MTAEALDPLIHVPARLQIMAALAALPDGDQFSFTEARTKVIRSFLNHLVHHRAQLGVYLRMNNIAIPGMYGPSADESFGA